jgi:hypothetical protein
MKKNYFLTLILTLFISGLSFGQVIITELADPNNNAGARFVEIYNISDSSVDLTGWELRRWTNGNSGPQGSGVDLSSIGTLNSGSFAIIAANATEFQTVYGITADINAGTGGAADSNGDDQVAIFDDADDTIDIFGVPGEDGTGTCHEFEDGRAERVSSVSASSSTWNEADWNVWADSTVSGCTSHINSPRSAPTDYDPGSWIGASETPSLSISAPSNNNTFSPETQNVSVSISVNNFTFSADDGSGASDGSGDGYIKGTLTETGESDQEEIFFSTTVDDIAVVAGRSYGLTMELVDNSGASLSPAVSSTINFSVASYTQAATIADVRAGTEGNYYELTGEAVMTYDAGNSRNQKYIQDASGAILIDDNDDVITTAYNVGDGITGIKGKLGSYGEVLQFVPQVDPGTASSTGNEITSEVVTIAELTANFENYESEWITINDVTFSDADGSATFASGQNYDITDGTNTLVFRTAFSNADIIGEVIPSSSADITGPASEFNGTAQIFGTSLANISLGVAYNTIAGFGVYPNPVKGNSLTVTTSSTEAKTVNIFNVLGRKVFSQRFSSMNKTMDISGISSGVYIMKVSEGNNIATKKLIIE